MSFLPWSNAEKSLKIGQIEFEKVVAMSDITEMDTQKDKAYPKPQTVQVVVWFLDNWQFGNYYKFISQDKTKEEKLKEFMTKLVLPTEESLGKSRVHMVTHDGLNAAGFKYGQILRVEKEFKKGRIIVSFDLEEWYSLATKMLDRNPPKLASPVDPETIEAAIATKKNQAAAEQEEGNAILAWMNDKLKPLWEE